MRKSLVKIASRIIPNLVVSFAYKQLANPQIRKLRDNELRTLEKAEREDFPFEGFNIKLYTWKGGNDKVLLIHGWEGQAGNFSDLVESLIEKGYTVYSFDGPSHGFSSKGKTSLFEFTDLVGMLIKKFGVSNLISHSFGGVATTYALYKNQDIEIDKYALLTTPDKFTERIDDVVNTVGITNGVKKRLIKKLEIEAKADVNSLNVSDFVKSINVKKSIIIHDKNDKVIPITSSLNVHRNWNVSTFKEIQGTGHFRILRTQSVIEDVVNFLGEKSLSN